MASRPLCEECLKLDLAEPALRRALDPRRSNAGAIAWAWVGAEVGAIDYDWRHIARRLTLTAAIDGVVTTQVVRIDSTAPRLGGSRPWFVCPLSGRRARMLFLPPGARQWASRAALDLAYASQRAGACERALQQLLGAAARGRRRNAMRRMLRRRLA